MEECDKMPQIYIYSLSRYLYQSNLPQATSILEMIWSVIIIFGQVLQWKNHVIPHKLLFVL